MKEAKTVKIAMISDVHGQWEKLNVPPCDILISAGDYIDYFGGKNKDTTADIEITNNIWYSGFGALAINGDLIINFAPDC